VRGAVAGSALAVALGLAGCTSGPGTKPHVSGTTATSSTAHSTTAPSTSAPSTTTSSSTTTTAAGVTDEQLTATVSAQLVAAGAARNGRSASGFTGLVPGTSYYAYDAATGDNWAGAGLEPSATTTPAQVSVQDDGSYLLFEQPEGGAWIAYDVGLAGTGGAACPVTVPPAVLALWGWPAGSCRAPNG
jgi:hypothetical protein